MIINLRGTSGSGKTTAVRRLIDSFLSTKLYDNSKRLIGHKVQMSAGHFVYVVGPYKTSCSGCDRMNSQDQICEIIRDFAKHGDVIFEGYRTSGSVKRYVHLARSLPDHQFLFLFMDTPLKICLERLNDRRHKNNIKKPLSSRHVERTHERLQRMPAELLSLGMDARKVPFQSVADSLQRLLLYGRRFPRIVGKKPLQRFPRLPKTRIINIRGTNGAGKSHITHKLLVEFGGEPLRDCPVAGLCKPGGVWAYRLSKFPSEQNWFVLGSYETTCGGPDRWNKPGDMEKIEQALTKLAGKGNVLFEGLVVGSTTKRWIVMQTKLHYIQFVFGYLDTPLRRCIKRVMQRRLKKGVKTEFNSLNLERKAREMEGSKKYLKDLRVDVRDIPYKASVKTVVGWMREK